MVVDVPLPWEFTSGVSARCYVKPLQIDSSALHHAPAASFILKDKTEIREKKHWKDSLKGFILKCPKCTPSFVVSCRFVETSESVNQPTVHAATLCWNLCWGLSGFCCLSFGTTKPDTSDFGSQRQATPSAAQHLSQAHKIPCFMRSTHFHHAYVESHCGILMLIACPGAIAASQRTIQLRSLPNCGGNQRAWKSMSTRCPPDWLYRLYAPRRLAAVSLGLSSLSRRGFLRSYATIRLADASRQHHILCAGSQRYRFSVKQSGLSEQGSEKRWKLT